MPLRGIDSQIMVTKATEVAAERARTLKQDDVLADQAAERNRQQAELSRSRTQAASHVEGGRVSSDGAGGGGPSGEGAGGGENQETAPETPALLDLPVERGEKTKQKNYTFDVTI